MPEIKHPIVYSAESANKIREAKRKPGFSHTYWSDPELESVRVEVRAYYRKEQKYKCAFCQQLASLKSAQGAQVEHIAPKSIYPQFLFEPKNLCVVCPDCNEYKKNREIIADKAIKTNAKRDYPKSTDKFRIYHPHYDNYKENIIKAGYLYFGLTEKGSHAIYVCNLDRFVQTFGMSSELLDSITTQLEQEEFHDT